MNELTLRSGWPWTCGLSAAPPGGYRAVSQCRAPRLSLAVGTYLLHIPTLTSHKCFQHLVSSLNLLYKMILALCKHGSCRIFQYQAFATEGLNLVRLSIWSNKLQNLYKRTVLSIMSKIWIIFHKLWLTLRSYSFIIFVYLCSVYSKIR